MHLKSIGVLVMLKSRIKATLATHVFQRQKQVVWNRFMDMYNSRFNQYIS